jgi:hypothetical protein
MRLEHYLRGRLRFRQAEPGGGGCKAPPADPGSGQSEPCCPATAASSPAGVLVPFLAQPLLSTPHPRHLTSTAPPESRSSGGSMTRQAAPDPACRRADCRSAGRGRPDHSPTPPPSRSSLAAASSAAPAPPPAEAAGRDSDSPEPARPPPPELELEGGPVPDEIRRGFRVRAQLRSGPPRPRPHKPEGAAWHPQGGGQAHHGPGPRPPPLRLRMSPPTHTPPLAGAAHIRPALPPTVPVSISPSGSQYR